MFRDCLYCPTVLGGLSVGLRGYLMNLYSVAVFNLYAFIFCLFCSLSCLTFHRVKSNKSARHRQNKAQQPFARAVYEHSVGCCLPLTAYRSSIGGKRTRLPRTNSNAKNTAQTPFALYPMLERLFAVILTVPVLFSKLHLFAVTYCPPVLGAFF